MASVHAHSSSVTRATCFQHGDVGTADGLNVILDTLAEAFKGEHETELSDKFGEHMGPSGRRVRGSMAMHFVYKATYEIWRSKEYSCQTKYRDFFCCVQRT